MSCKNCNTNCYSAGTDGEMCSAWTKKEENDNEIINIQFSGKEFDLILKYQKAIEADSVQAAILNAISLVLDNADDIICTKVSPASIGIR